MAPPDDLRIDVPSTSSTGQGSTGQGSAGPGSAGPGKPGPTPTQPAKPLREVGPESEVRGGPEAPEDALDPRPAPPDA